MSITIIDVNSQLSNSNWSKYFNLSFLNIVVTTQDNYELDIKSVIDSIVNVITSKVDRFDIRDVDSFFRLIIINIDKNQMKKKKTHYITKTDI